ncbi:hypothetical protein SLA2020_017310 [Shorea laevis]
MDHISLTWYSPLLILKEINPWRFLLLYQTLKSNRKAKIDLLSILDLSCSLDGANIDRLLTYICPLKIYYLSSRPHLNILEAIGEMKQIDLFIWSLYNPMSLQEMDYKLLVILYHFWFTQIVISKPSNPTPILC